MCKKNRKFNAIETQNLVKKNSPLGILALGNPLV